MKKYVITASFAALFLTGHADAADIVVAPQPTPVYVAPAFSWAGFYAGGQIGWKWAQSDAKFSDLALSPMASGSVGAMSFDNDGFMGGLYAGYNFDLGHNVILGIETDWTWADLDGSDKSDVTVMAHSSGMMRGQIKEKWAGATRLRLGYAMNRFLPYIAGGVAYNKLESKTGLYGSDGVTRYLGGKDNDILTGWTIGAGVDYAVTDHLLLRLEYRYSDFGDTDFKYNGSFTGSNIPVKYNTDYKTHDVRIGIAYKF